MLRAARGRGTEDPGGRDQVTSEKGLFRTLNANKGTLAQDARVVIGNQDRLAAADDSAGGSLRRNSFGDDLADLVARAREIRIARAEIDFPEELARRRLML